METTVTPAAAPPAAAPAAATATTTSTPATPSTPVSVTQPDGAQGSGALSPDQSIKAMLSAAESKGFGKEETTPPPATTKPAATETPAAEATTETPAADATTDPDATTTEDETPSYSLEVDGFTGAKDLAAKLDANPALKAALPADLRNEIMANARLAERGSEYEKFFASPAEAKVITETAQEFASYSEAFSLIQADPAKGTTAFIQKLIEASVLRDDQGNPLKHPNGAFQTDGSANRFVEEIGRRWVNHNIAEKIKGIQDSEVRENVQAALDLVMESVGLLPSTADKTNQDPAIATREAELTRREDALKQEQATTRANARKEFQDGLNSDLVKLYDSETGTLLKAATGLNELTRTAVEKQLEEAIKTGIKSNVAYQRRKALLQAQPMGPKRRQAELALAKEFFADNLVRIAKPIFTKAGITLKGASEKRSAAQSAREDNARSEVNGGRAVTPATTTPTSGSYSEQRAAATAAWKAQNPGKEPSDSDLNIFMMLSAVKAKGLVAA